LARAGLDHNRRYTPFAGALLVATLIAPLVVLASVWSPLFFHYYTQTPSVDGQLVAAARQAPPGNILEELDQLRLFPARWAQGPQLLPVAESLLRGDLAIPGYPPAHIVIPFSPVDFESGSSEWQLEFASLAVPEIFMDAYRVSGREEFFATATQALEQWATYERHSSMPNGLLWNDHAIAARVLVLAKFWHLYRARPNSRLQIAADILEMAARCAQLLARPSHFTFATNHGVMQNLALWHFCLSFPSLPHVSEYKQLALARLRDQMAFYVDDEGVVLEHSAHYHHAGVQFLGMACRYLTLLGMPIPSDWLSKYRQSKSFYALIRRPDATLPAFGDTDGVPDPAGPKVARSTPQGDVSALADEMEWQPPRSAALFPLSGYAVEWDGLESWPDQRRLSQTVLAWSNFKGHGHKHADELSLLFWGNGHSWWTNVGYWPDSSPARSDALSWSGSDAPHLVTEPLESAREAHVLDAGSSSDLTALTLVRVGPGKFTATRQVLHVVPNLWIVLDSMSGPVGANSTTTWTVAPAAHLERSGSTGWYIFSADNPHSTLTTFLIGSPEMKVRRYRGSLKPFAGWQILNSTPVEADALVVEQPANHSWSANIWSLADGENQQAAFLAAPSMQQWVDSQNWNMVIPLAAGTLSIKRSGQTIQLDPNAGGKGRVCTLQLTAVAKPEAQAAVIQDAFDRMAEKYPRFKDLVPYRTRVTYLITLALLLQELTLAAVHRLWPSRTLGLRFLALTVWIAAGTWLSLVYFRT
jgi:hypothetical protein